MAYAIEPNRPLVAETRRIAGEQLDKAIEELADSSRNPHEAIHQLRKRCKKMRGLLRLMKGGLGRRYAMENRWFRDCAKSFSEYRDMTALVETIDVIPKGSCDEECLDLLDVVSSTLSHRRDQAFAKNQSQIENALDRLIEQFEGVKQRVREWEFVESDPLIAFRGMRNSYHAGSKCRRKAERAEDDETLHSWRKRVKDQWYHNRLLKKAWKPVMKVRNKQLSKLASLLGDDHDLAVLTTTIGRDPVSFGNPRQNNTLLALVRKRRAELQSQALQHGRLIFAEAPSQFATRIESYWKVQREESRFGLSVAAFEG